MNPRASTFVGPGTFVTALRIGLLVFLPAAQTVAQSPTVLDLFRVAWTDDAHRAMARYALLSPTERSPRLLIELADQLLWTGKHQAASIVLDRAESEAPRMAEIRFQQGRAHLQRGESAPAMQAFRSGMAVASDDTTLSESERSSLQRRLQNRIWFLERTNDLVSRNGAYRTADGRILLFKFDPYINTFPSLLDVGTGVVRTLYPDSASALAWRDAEGRTAGSLRFEGGNGNNADLVIRTSDGEARARGLRIRQEAIRIDTGAFSVEATLFRPDVGGAVPALVLTHGAGLSTRYNLVTEALAFAASGAAALVYDKPGLGRSTGGNWLLLSIPEQATIVAAAVMRLKKRPDVNAVGVWGFSQGGWVGPLAASRMDTIDFVIIASGAAVSPQEQSLQAATVRLRSQGVPDRQVQEVVAYTREMWRRVNAGAGLADFANLHAVADTAPWGRGAPRMRMEFELKWWRDNEVDAGRTLEALKVPVLALFGEADDAVPPTDNVPIMARHLSAAPTSDYTVTVLPNANHQFMTADDYQPLYFSTMTAWLSARFGPPWKEAR